MAFKTKYLLRDFCKYVYYAGAGNCWCEDIYSETIPYKVYSVISFTIYTAMVFLENLAALFGNFPEVEKNSAVMFAAIHNIVLTKMYLLLYHKISIRKLNYEMANVGKNLEEVSLMRRQYRKVKIGIILYIISVYLSLTAYGVESARRVIYEGAPFYTVVTYFPSYESTSLIASISRVVFYIIWLYMMLPMMSADCMPITHLITMAYKFMTLCRHFERIREEFEENMKMDKKRAIDKLKLGYIEGIKMHQKLMFLADEIHRVFGIIMSLQVCESSAVAVLLLLRLARSPHLDLTNAFMTYTFVWSLFLLLALNLWNAGEITHQSTYPVVDSALVTTTLACYEKRNQASLLSSAMFYCGWHLCELEMEKHQDIRRLVMISCVQAQKPLILKAFGVQALSYATFVSVARTTYSIFAVFYQRRE